MNIIIYTLIVALAIGFALGVLLGLFKKIFYVKVDPKIQEVRDVLSGANCGGCGYVPSLPPSDNKIPDSMSDAPGISLF